MFCLLLTIVWGLNCGELLAHSVVADMLYERNDFLVENMDAETLTLQKEVVFNQTSKQVMASSDDDAKGNN
ncbi:hypothetical protein JHK85_007030 [Glycine max]|nr:hypothetical protein JHK85_007030 [Glycine max]